jgi:hypothetical protein
MIGAEPMGQPFSACGLMEQTAQRSPIHGRSRVDPEPDDPTCALVHDDEDPISFESEGFTPEEIHAPQAILCVAKERQPRGSVGLVGSIVRGEGPSHDIFLDGNRKGLGYLFGNFDAPNILDYDVSSLAPAQ